MNRKGYTLIELLLTIGFGGTILLVLGLVISLIIFLISNS